MCEVSISCSSSDENVSPCPQRIIQPARRRPNPKYKCRNASKYQRREKWNISSSSSNDEQTNGEETICKTPMTTRIHSASWRMSLGRSQRKTPQQTQQYKFQALPVSVTKKSSSSPSTSAGQSQSPRALSEVTNSPVSSKDSTTPKTANSGAWQRLRNTLAPLKHNQSALHASPVSASAISQENVRLEDTLIECSPASSAEQNVGLKNDVQLTKKTTPKSKQRCIKGGYVDELQRAMQKLRMDRRCLAHNRALGMQFGTTVRVVDIFSSFGVRVARVRPEDDSVIFAEICSVILAADMAANVAVGTRLQVCCDMEPLELPNKEKVYVQPHKILLLES